MLSPLSDAVNKRLLIKVPLETDFFLLLHPSATVGKQLPLTGGHLDLETPLS